MQKFHKIKREPFKSFLCALCSSSRKMRYKRNLSFRNYLQVSLLGLTLSFCLWDLMSFHSLIVFPFLWCIVEFTNKLLYRRELPCPHCGFDATWYRRDVKVAKTKVKEFWEIRNQGKYNVDENSHLEDLLQ